MKDARAHLTPEERECDRGPVEGGTFEKCLYDLFYAAVQAAHLAGSTGKGWSPSKAYDEMLATHTQAAIQMVVDELSRVEADWNRTHQSEKVMDRIRIRKLELEKLLSGENQ